MRWRNPAETEVPLVQLRGETNLTAEAQRFQNWKDGSFVLGNMMAVLPRVLEFSRFVDNAFDFLRIFLRIDAINGK